MNLLLFLGEQIMVDMNTTTQNADSIEFESIRFRDRISWKAVFAGTLTILVLQLLLSLLGIGIGASIVDPLKEQDPMSGLGIGSGIWLILSTILSVYVGSMVAGRLTLIPMRIEGALHGFLTWALASLATVYLISTVSASLVSGTAGIVGKTASMLGQGVSAVAPGITSAIKDQAQEQGIDLNSIKNEAMTFLRQNVKNTPNAANTASDDQANTAGSTENTQAPDQASTDLFAIIDRTLGQGKEKLEAPDREALVKALTTQTSMSPDEAGAAVDRWQETTKAAQAKMAEAAQQAEQKAREAGDAAARGISKAALWSFISMLLGAIVSVFGGIQGMATLGTRPTVSDDLPSSPMRRFDLQS
jgi:hypothetical protein